MKNTTWLLGGISGLLVSAGSLGPMLGTDGSSGEAQGSGLGFLMMLLVAIGALVAMVLFVRKNPDAKFGQLIKTGLGTALVTTLVYYVCSVVFYQWVMPADFLENLREAHIQKKALTIADEAKRAAFIAKTQSNEGVYGNPFVYSAMQAIVAFMMCLAPIAVCGYVIFRVKGRRQPAAK